MSAILFRTLLALTALVALEPSAWAAKACRIVENRNHFVQNAKENGLGNGVSVVRNPIFAMLESGKPEQVARASALVEREVQKMGADASLRTHLTAIELRLIKENLGTEILRRKRAVDFEVTYGSQRTKGDGSVRLIVSVHDLHTGARRQKLLEVPRAKTLAAIQRICKSRRCDAEAIIADPSRFEPAVKTLIGLEVSKEVCRK